MESRSVNLRCSSLDRALNCHGSILASSVLPTPESGAESIEGTFLHWLAHAKIRDELGAEGALEEPDQCPDNIQLSAWIADFYFRAVRDLVPTEWALEMEASLEAEIPLLRPVGDITHVKLTGHPDDISVNADATEAIGLDLKAGYDPVDPAECNEQVFGYSILLLEAYPSLRKITYYIVQPRNNEDDGFARISEPMILEGERLNNSKKTFIERINRALENQYETDSGPKQCRWCPVAKLRPWLCPSLKLEQDTMKATLTTDLIEAMKAKPDDAALAGFVITGRTLSAPTEAATELLHKRIDELGYVDANGIRITVKKSKGAYEVLEPEKFFAEMKATLGADDRIARCIKPSMTRLKDEIAEARSLPKTSKNKESAESVFEDRFRPLVSQGEKRQLVFVT